MRWTDEKCIQNLVKKRVPRLLRNTKFHYSAYKSPALVSGQMNPAHNILFLQFRTRTLLCTVHRLRKPIIKNETILNRRWKPGLRCRNILIHSLHRDYIIPAQENLKLPYFYFPCFLLMLRVSYIYPSPAELLVRRVHPTSLILLFPCRKRHLDVANTASRFKQRSSILSNFRSRVSPR
jgi:hypothetical protein